MKRIVKGEEILILKEDPDGGYLSIPTANLTKKMDEIFTEDVLTELAEKVVIPLNALKNMPFIAYIKADIADKNVSGWGQHKKALKDEGYDV